MVNLDTGVGVADVNVRSLAEHWWALTIRGGAAILFGVLLFLAPGIGLLTLIALFGAYALIDGVFNIVAAVRHARANERWGWLAFSGLISILAGVLTFLLPRITGFALLMVIAGWSIVTGVAQIVAAVRLRKEIQGEWLLGLGGALSIAFGVLVALFPAAGALAVALWIGAYAIVFGGLTVALSLKLRAWHAREERHPPVGGVATPA
jgi:uncharacterized membrane protein HdeD (DUF308 family)